MKKLFLILYSIIGIQSVSNALTIDYLHAVSSDGTLTSSFIGAVVETFDSPTWEWEGSGQVVLGSLPGKYAAPYNSQYMSDKDLTHYMSVPDPDGASTGAYATSFKETYTYFGLFWGSIDGYNSLSFYNGLDLVHSFNGKDITKPGEFGVNYGNQSAPSTNLYVNFYDLNPFDKVIMTSLSFAFEADNLAVGNRMIPNPEPATVILFGFGLLGVAGISRKEK
ncbi:MAG: PEP-CTERM sorting domain-containing protein [Pseudomonadota bacterium]